ncbi:hypothetical protein D3C81_1313340 [compost metagenome]
MQILQAFTYLHAELDKLFTGQSLFNPHIFIKMNTFNIIHNQIAITLVVHLNKINNTR